MVKIKELIQIQKSYSNQVNLKTEFEDIALRAERIANYKPIKAHRKAFEIIAEGCYSKNSKRCFILSGSYGTGKSHLLLMAANYFESQSDTEEMKAFFNNYKESEENESNKYADILKKNRKEGRYLVCICNYGKGNLEGYILRAVKEALQREGISEQEMDSYYLQAIRMINQWKGMEDKYFIEKFEKMLERRSDVWTIDKMINELSDYNKDAIEIFKELYKNITLADFNYDNDNYVQIIQQISKSKSIIDKFKGIVILFDEFDYQLQGKRFDLDEFQKFCELNAASFMKNFPIIFVASTHHSFASYGSIYNSKDFTTVNDRIREIPLETQGIEDIISAVVNPQKKSEYWEKFINPRISVFNQLSNECKSLKIFDWLSTAKVKMKIIENIYPMHPMATYSLLKLASDVGSNNRSVFTFFADEKKDIGSYDEFVKNNDIINSSNELQFYTVDMLFDYFKDKISSDNQELRHIVKEIVRNFETSLRELSKIISTSQNLELHHDIYVRILKTMVIYQIIGTDTNFKTLKFGLNKSTQEKENELEHSLKNLCLYKIIYLNETNHCYEFKRNDAKDVNGLIRDYKQFEENFPSEIMTEIDYIIKNSEVKKISKFFKDEFYLNPDNYNFNFKEDKRLIRKFCSVKELGDISYLDKLVQEMKDENDNKKSYEGIALYILCESEDDIKNAKRLTKNNKYKNIIIGVPSEEIKLIDEVFSLKAANSIDKDDFSSQDIWTLNDIIDHYDNSLSNKLKQYITSKNLIYFGEKGYDLTNCSPDDFLAAKIMLENIYENKRNKINHEDFNKVHVFKEGKNTALREAIEILLNLNKQISFRKDYAADRGDIKYIQNVLLQHGVIKQIQTIGNEVICEIEHDVDKYSKVLPALTEMIKEIQELNVNIRPQGLLENYMYTYGIGYNAAILFFAVAKRYFKDSISILPEAHDIGTLQITSYDSLLDLLFYKKYKNAVLEYKKVQQHDMFLIKELYKLFNNNYIKVNETITVEMTYEVLLKWYKNIYSICKVKSVFNSKLDNFIDVFNKISKVNNRDFILEEIKTIYGYERQDLILEEDVMPLIEKIRKDKGIIEQGYYIVRDNFLKEIQKIFNSRDYTYEEINKAVSIWLEGLTETQRSFNNELQNEDSRPLVMHLGKYTDCEEVFMKILPLSYNLDIVANWAINKTESYVQKIKSGKLHVEQNVYSIKPPKYELIGKELLETPLHDGSIKVSYIGYIKIKIYPDGLNKKIYITSNGCNPTDINVQREESAIMYTLETKDDKIIKFCGLNDDGKYSKILTLNLTNQANKYEVKFIPQQNTIFESKETNNNSLEFKTFLPKDEESLIKCIKSIIRNSKEKYKIKDKDLVDTFKALLEELER
jgi:hypothetical protein